MRGDTRMTVVEHLEELRKALLISLLAVAVCSVALYAAFREELFGLAARPVTNLGFTLSYLGVAEAFITKLKLSLLGGVVLASPVLAWQLWNYLLPALYSREKRLLGAMIPASALLFAAGVAFGYFAVLPTALRFLLLVAGEGLNPVLSVGSFLSFLLSFLLPFGFAFQLPLIAFVLARWGIVTSGLLVRYRRYVLVGVALLAAVLTPGPDVFSQVMLSGPMYVLYEVSILVARLAGRPGEAGRQAPAG